MNTNFNTLVSRKEFDVLLQPVVQQFLEVLLGDRNKRARLEILDVIHELIEQVLMETQTVKV